MEPIILSLESATTVCSVAISQGTDVLHLEETNEGNKHSEWMTLYIQKSLKTLDMNMNDVDAIAVSMGPGSYTGLRVGYSIAKAIAYTLQIPLIEVNTVRSISFGMKNPNKNEIIIPMIDARRMEVYMQILDNKRKSISPIEAVILPEYNWDSLIKYDAIHIVGNGAKKFYNIEPQPVIHEKVIVHENIECSAQWLVYEAIEKFNFQQFADIAYSVPFYLKSPNITKSKKPLF